MQTLRTLVIVAVLATVGYGVYVTLHQEPPGDPPEEVSEGWDQPPSVDMPAAPLAPHAVPTARANSGEAPPFGAEADTAQAMPPSPWGTAPPFEPAPVEAAAPGSGAPLNSAGSAMAAPDQLADGGSHHRAPHETGGAGSGAAEAGAIHANHGQMPQAAPTSPVYGERYADAAPSADVQAQFEAAMQEIQEVLEQGRLADAHAALSEWYNHPRLSEADHERLMHLLDRVAGTVVYSQMHIIEPAYEVQPGDTLDRIARLYNVPWQLLAKINGVDDPNRLRTGQQLKVIRGPFDASIELEQYQLTLWLDGRYAGRFPIGIGRDYSTPEGEFVVRDKVENPTYYGPDRVIDANDPENPLGDRWIDLGNQFGIHGTNEPQTIGQSESRGCIRLSSQDIEDVYDILSVGSRVIIRR